MALFSDSTFTKSGQVPNDLVCRWGAVTAARSQHRIHLRHTMFLFFILLRAPTSGSLTHYHYFYCLHLVSFNDSRCLPFWRVPLFTPSVDDIFPASSWHVGGQSSVQTSTFTSTGYNTHINTHTHNNTHKTHQQHELTYTLTHHTYQQHTQRQNAQRRKQTHSFSFIVYSYILT